MGFSDPWRKVTEKFPTYNAKLLCTTFEKTMMVRMFLIIQNLKLSQYLILSQDFSFSFPLIYLKEGISQVLGQVPHIWYRRTEQWIILMSTSSSNRYQMPLSCLSAFLMSSASILRSKGGGFEVHRMRSLWEPRTPFRGPQPMYIIGVPTRKIQMLL